MKKDLETTVNIMSENECDEFLSDNCPENALGDNSLKEKRLFIVDWCKKNKISNKKLRSAFLGLDSCTEEH